MATAHRLDHKHFLVPPGKKIRLKDFDPAYTAGFKDKEEAQAALLEDVSGLAAAQDVLWASREYSIIIIFQALDAAGKDGTIKHVMSGVNPQGVTVQSFKAPSEEERQHHFLWRPTRALPARGVISIFNRSYYEEVLVVRVHPGLFGNAVAAAELARERFVAGVADTLPGNQCVRRGPHEQVRSHLEVLLECLQERTEGAISETA